MYTIPGLASLHKLTYGHSKIKIAVLDGPVDLEHSCFQSSNGKLIPWDAQQVRPAASGGLALMHGTAVASLIFGTPGSSVQGIAPGCSSMLIPIYSDHESGKFYSATQVELARAIKIAIDQGAHIINISGGQLSSSGESEFLLKQAIEDSHKAGILIVAAAGNDGCNCLHVPAADHHVLAVGSMDGSGEPTAETNFGSSYQFNGILAPGKQLTAALPGGGTFQTTGATSYATPVVSGIVGLLMSLQIESGREPDPYAIRSILLETAIPCAGDEHSDTCRRFLKGKLNLPAAIEAITKSPSIGASGINPTHKINLGTMQHSSNSEYKEIRESAAVMPADNHLDNQSPPDQLLPQIPAIPQVDVEKAAAPTATKSSSTINNQLNMENQPATLVEPQALAPKSEGIAPSCGCGGNSKSSCSCGGKATTPAPILVYALGSLNYDFGSISHRDSINQSMGYDTSATPPRKLNPDNPEDMLIYLKRDPSSAADLIWTVNINATPIYALVPQGAYAAACYTEIVSFFDNQTNPLLPLGGKLPPVMRSSFPGISGGGSVTLQSGLKVPVLVPKIRGMYNWELGSLITTAITALSIPPTEEDVFRSAMINFLEKLYFELRNMGVTSGERALNYAGTNVLQAATILKDTIQAGLTLSNISVEPSPICSPGLDCQDVVLTFFDPTNRDLATQVYRFTVDVSDIVPVTMGQIEHWPQF